VREPLDFDKLVAFVHDPADFVQFCFPWGQGELEGMTGPTEWQLRVLHHISAKLKEGYRPGNVINEAMIRIARSSGHGIGKSTCVAWIILWALATFPDTRGVVTANTKTQLETKTRAELAKWHRLFFGSHLFRMTATSIMSSDPTHEMTWRLDFIPWSENNPEAFAGLHNKGKRLLVIFDEASYISDSIWETTEGALTDIDTEILWCVFGNPTRSVGRFRDCFGRFAQVWNTETIDAREVPFNTNAKLHQEWITLYGEDSDFVRVRVRGVFPRTGEMEFISSEVVEAACLAEAYSTPNDPLVIGVDVARYGANESVIWFRKGRDARTIPPVRLRGISTVDLAGKVSEAFYRYRVDGIFVDGGGVGGGVVDQLRALHIHVFDINFGSKPQGMGWATGNEGERYANKRAEMWGAMRAWLSHGAIPSDADLKTQLVGPTYTYTVKNEIQLEKKEDMMHRGIDSPDLADALALTFAMPVAPHQGRSDGPEKPLVESEYNPFDPKFMMDGVADERRNAA
jgi:hypothetical protein